MTIEIDDIETLNAQPVIEWRPGQRRCSAEETKETLDILSRYFPTSAKYFTAVELHQVTQ